MTNEKSSKRIDRQQLSTLEQLRDDCDRIISILIRDDEAPTIPVTSAKRLVKVLRKPRHLFDFGDGWPSFEVVESVLGLEPATIAKLAIELDNLTTSHDPPSSATRQRTKSNLVPLQTPTQTILSLRYGYAEVPLWHLRQWLDKTITSATSNSCHNESNAIEQTYQVSRLPPSLWRFGQEPSFGFRTTASDEIHIIEGVKIERANHLHEAILQAVRERLVLNGIDCFQSALIDLACLLNDTPQIFEAKSITDTNEIDQVRAAYAQLLDYRFRYSNVKPFANQTTGLWIALSSRPAADWTLKFLTAANIRLVWLDDDGQLGGSDASLIPT
jgi:hypothetical protein